MSGAPLAAIDRLSVSFAVGAARVAAVVDLTLTLGAGERLALLGESGSGKTITARALAGLLPDEAIVVGSIRWPGLPAQPRAGRDIGFVFQDPGTSLNPVLTIGEQIGEVLTTHAAMDLRAARRRVIELLTQVGIAEPALRIDGYPHEFSGGQRQRIAIAIAIAAAPALLIADEPTAALDTVVQAQIMALIARLLEVRTMALLLVTHDIALAARNADRLAILYAGCLAEVGSVATVLAQPRHPYTRGLLAATLPFAPATGAPLPEIPGTLPAPGEPMLGCRFAPRCAHAMAHCRRESPPWHGTVEVGVACWLHVVDA